MEIDHIKITLIFAFLTLWLYWLWTRRHFYKFALNFPGSFGLPIIGSFYKNVSLAALLDFCGDSFKRFQTHSALIWFGFYPIILTEDPELFEQLLTHNEQTKSNFLYRPLNRLLKGGLISAKFTPWKHNRKLMNPIFKQKMILGFMPIIENAKRDILESLNKFALATGEHHVFAQIERVILFESSIAVTLGRFRDRDYAYEMNFVEKFRIIMEGTSSEIFLSAFNLQSLMKLHPTFDKSVNELHGYFDDMLISRFKLLQKERTQSTEKSSMLFIDQALNAYENNQLDWKQVQAEMVTLFVASYETSFNALCSSLVLLAMHPDVQQQLFEELLDVFPDKNFEMTYEQMQNLTYLDMVVNETLRLAPSVPVMGRQMSEDLTLKDGVVVPKGVSFLMSIYNLHRRTDIWGPDAHKFDPNNFLHENMSKRHTFAFIPFSKGLRNCIGWRYALFSIKIILSGIIRNFVVKTSFRYEDLKFVENISMKFETEPKLEFIKRDK